MGNEIATVHISKFFIILLQCSNSQCDKDLEKNAVKRR